MRICSKCKVDKETADFNKSLREKDGLKYQCKKCESEYRKNQDKRTKNISYINDCDEMIREEVCYMFSLSISGLIGLEKKGLKSTKKQGIKYYKKEDVEMFFEDNLF